METVVGVGWHGLELGCKGQDNGRGPASVLNGEDLGVGGGAGHGLAEYWGALGWGWFGFTWVLLS